MSLKEPIKIENTLIIENTKIGPIYSRLTVESKELAAIAQPGQFVMVKPIAAENSTIAEPFMFRRPFSIHMADKEKNTVSVLYQIKEGVTQIIAEKQPGETISILGPLGNAIPMSRYTTTSKETAIVAGGIGLAPMGFLIKELNKAQITPTLYYGVRNKDLSGIIDTLKNLEVSVKIASEDGSIGKRGFVTGLLQNDLTENSIVFACGPMPMLHRVADLCIEKEVPVYGSLETVFACGTGACMGCVIKLKDANGEVSYCKVCEDGPIFNLKKVLFYE